MRAFPIILFLCFISLSCKSSLAPATLYLKNGNVMEGFALKDPIKMVTFKEDLKGRGTNYYIKDIDAVEYNTSEGVKRYVILPVVDKRLEIVVEEILAGKVSLYLNNQIGYSPGMVGGGPGGMMSMGTVHSIDNYYLKRDSDQSLTHLGSNQLFTKNFSAAASEFFEDCPVLVKKIEEKEFKKRDLREIVSFYNSECL